ncbi:hypothetical protein P43SY_006468 [Pythium insidiosum]|uniref:Uncharacterized protein n=1 Tax=Pythium insidiosum TaxID=114742 RepID=A0AAD5LWU2_PYTIN|nr:hypothetical protein P43SY_006468 [Pythium insidiosum]
MFRTAHLRTLWTQSSVYVGEQWSGAWSRDGRQLRLRILGSLDPQRLLPLQQLMQGLAQTTLHGIARTSSSGVQQLRFHGDVRYRIDPPGRYRLRLVVPDETSSKPPLSSLSPVFSVQTCGDAVVILKGAVAEDAADEGAEERVKRRVPRPLLPTPRFALRGVTSHGGSEGLRLRDAELGLRDGAWSLSLWLWTAQRPTGAFRTLFFHGNGSGEHRTPSAWFRPHDRRLVLRVSTTEDMDVGLDSQREIPQNEWDQRFRLTQLKLKSFCLAQYKKANGTLRNLSDCCYARFPSKTPRDPTEHDCRRFSLVYAELSAYHYFHAAQVASRVFHERGKQPLHEKHRLYDGIKTDITQGERGDDDDLIQFQKMRADKDGDVEAMAAMGDLYYWGARGMPRDHDQAYSYFHRAAQGGHTAAQSALAGMLLRGEGAPRDNEGALKWYRLAAAANHTRALNGLGFLHFEGAAGLPENKTMALELFERAAANEEDGDSLFNAGYCHANGLGTAVNWTRAIHYYDIAAKRFGHFDAILALGTIWYNGVDAAVVSRDPSRALTYLRAASEAGAWGAYMRQGFDLFLDRRWQQAALKYHAAEQVGVALATSNLAYIYDQHMRHSRGVDSEQQALRYLLAAHSATKDKEVLVPIGDYHFYGFAGLSADASEAIRWYSRASAAGVESGAYNVGHMHEYGLGVAMNLDRAERYYRRALELAPASMENWIAIRLALARLMSAWTLFYETATDINFLNITSLTRYVIALHNFIPFDLLNVKVAGRRSFNVITTY